MNLVMMYQQNRRAGRPFSSFSSLILCPSNPPSCLLSYCGFLPTLCREAPPELATRSLCPPHGCSRSGEPAPTTPRLLRSQPGPPPSTPMMSSSSRPSPAATCGMGRCVQVSQHLKADLGQDGGLWPNTPHLLFPQQPLTPLLLSSGSGHPQILSLCA